MCLNDTHYVIHDLVVVAGYQHELHIGLSLASRIPIHKHGALVTVGFAAMIEIYIKLPRWKTDKSEGKRTREPTQGKHYCRVAC